MTFEMYRVFFSDYKLSYFHEFYLFQEDNRFKISKNIKLQLFQTSMKISTIKT